MTLEKNASNPLRILFIKPYQSQSQSKKGMHLGYSPPLGLISIAATLRERFAEKIDVRMVDMKVLNEEPELIVNYLKDFNPHIVGVSALNCEMSAAHKISENTKQYNTNIITVLGGPYALHRAEEIFYKSTFDWIFNGAADLTFPEAVHCVITGEDLGNDIVGFNYRKEDNSLQLSSGQDSIEDL
ncbi:MAG TPA: cobalamin B12-binding domain-containing protein, partial [Nitrospirae bacterium]|nr:cobalamin B12-binding domain-containing protein [Nitrospirota bacterium]